MSIKRLFVEWILGCPCIRYGTYTTQWWAERRRRLAYQSHSSIKICLMNKQWEKR
jgi:hypothetical protein